MFAFCIVRGTFTYLSFLNTLLVPIVEFAFANNMFLPAETVKLFVYNLIFLRSVLYIFISELYWRNCTVFKESYHSKLNRKWMKNISPSSLT